MALARVKTWSSGEILTASDLNAEFNNILNNARDLVSPLTASLDMNGLEFILDADADSSITVDTDDRLDVRLGGVDLFVFNGTAASLVNGFTWTGAATGARPRLAATGSDTNIGVAIRPKGTGAGASVVLEDGSGNEVLIGGVATASAVNEVTVTNAATGTGPSIAATGGDTNIPVTVAGKGTGHVILGQATSTDVRLAADQPITDSSGNELLKFTKTATAVNEITVANAAAGGTPTFSATGGDTNIALKLTPKGTGRVQFTDGTDATKIVSLDASGLTTGNTRIITIPDRAITLNSLSPITASLSGDVALNNTANYFTGPSIAQGTSGTWFVSGVVTANDTAGTANIHAKLWDGSTVICSSFAQPQGAGGVVSIHLSGYIVSPAGDLRISVRDSTSTSGNIKFDSSGNAKDSTITAIRVA